MKRVLRNNDNGASRLLEQLAAEKKKVVIALCLISVMVFMWVRVLGGKTPKTAEATLTARNAGGSQSSSELKISFIELPNVKGRNDVLSRDFFAVGNWRDFIRRRRGKNLTGVEEVSVVSRDSEEVARRVAEKLKLEAIGMGEPPQAFINDKLLAAGEELLVKDGDDTYECEVVGIEETKVFIRCGEAEITLKLTRATGVIDY